ncbi:MAG: PorP/SprF family type IX secretion system membrane protein [Bacteroidales bacterium]
MRKIILIGVIFVFFRGFLNAQDIHFSQMNNTPLLLNPALAGAFHGDNRVILNYKDQWGSITIPYRTIAASYDMPIFKKKERPDNMGFGVSFFSDKAGDASMGTNQVNLSLAYNKGLQNSNNIIFGLQAGLGQRSFDFSKLSWDNQYTEYGYDPNLPSNEPLSYNNNFYYFDFTGGAAWNYVPDRYFQSMLGVALYHINQPRLHYYESSDERLNPKLVIHGYADIVKKHANLTYMPCFILFKQGPQYEFTLGSMFKYRLQEASLFTGYYEEENVFFGIWYRLNDAIIPCVRFEFRKFTFGLTYDVNVSKLTKISHARGGIEISLMYIKHGKSKRHLAKPSFL